MRNTSFLRASIALAVPAALCAWIFYQLFFTPGAEKLPWETAFWAGQKAFWLGHLMSLIIAWREAFVLLDISHYRKKFYSYRTALKKTYAVVSELFSLLLASAFCRWVWIASAAVGYAVCALISNANATNIIPFIVFGVLLDAGHVFWLMLAHWPEERVPAYAGNPQAQPKVPPGAEFYKLEKDPDAYKKIIGLAEPKKRIQEAIEIMLNTETGQRMKEYGLKPPKGIILYGPPGTGKTSFARATAQIFGLPFIVVNASSVAGSLVGATEQNIRSIFKFARQVSPCVIFWDEIDVVAKKREGGDFNTPSQLALNVLLAELDGFNPLSGVIFIAATNRLDILDPAVLRPGRLDLHIEVGLPAVEDRYNLLCLYLQGRPVEITETELMEIAQSTAGYSPARIEHLCHEAARQAFYEQQPVTAGHLLRSINTH